MPRDGTETYVQPFPDVVEDTTIESPVYNGFVSDIAQDLNTPRPIKFGGTGANNATDALTNLGGELAKQVVTNYDSMVWMAGSFLSAGTATAAPVSAHAFTGIVYLSDANNIVVEARDASDGKLYIRRKVAGVWGAWALDGDLSGVNAAIALKVDKVGDTMTGPLVLPAAAPTLGTQATNKSYVDGLDAAQKIYIDSADTALATVNGTQTTDIANRVRYDAAQGLSTAQQTQARQNISASLRGRLAGLTLSTAGSSATFSIAAGEAADSTNATLMQLASAITKTTGAWAVGSGNGGLDTGAIATSTWYHAYLIKRPDTGVVDVLLSLNATTPTTLPTNYTLYRRIGAMKTNPSSQWIKFIQIDDTFIWDTPAADATAVTQGTTAALAIVSVPLGLQVIADIQALAIATAAGGGILVTSPSVSTQVLGTPSGNVTAYAPVANLQGVGYVRVLTDTSSRVRVVGNAAATNQYSLSTIGWTDTRGRLQ